MTELISVVLVVVLLVALGMLAERFGADTRDGRDWQPRSEWRET